MRKRLSKYGNSLALIIDKPILELLNIQEDTILKVTTDGVNITIAPIHKSSKKQPKISEDPEVQKGFEEAMEYYAPALKKLAKNL